MHPVVYDLCRLAGLVLVTVAAGMAWGTPAALATSGGLLIVLTEVGARR
jgi:hypothetical protein